MSATATAKTTVDHAPRTGGQILAEEPAVGILGGQAFKIRPQKKGKSERFRRKCAEVLTSLSNIGPMMALVKAAMDEKEIPIHQLPVGDFIAVGGQILCLCDEAANLIFEYDPLLGLEELAVPAEKTVADEDTGAVTEAAMTAEERQAVVRAWVDANATDQECVAFLIEIFKVAYGPFVRWLPAQLSRATRGGSEEAATTR